MIQLSRLVPHDGRGVYSFNSPGSHFIYRVVTIPGGRLAWVKEPQILGPFPKRLGS